MTDEEYIGKKTQDELVELVQLCLDYLPQDRAIEVIVGWARTEDLFEDFAIQFSQLADQARDDEKAHDTEEERGGLSDA